jgi:hypothetical protein
VELSANFLFASYGGIIHIRFPGRSCKLPLSLSHKLPYMITMSVYHATSGQSMDVKMNMQLFFSRKRGLHAKNIYLPGKTTLNTVR